MDKSVKVVVIGDPGVGKTSLISTAATDSFDTHPPPVLPRTRMPAEMTADGVALLVTDTSSKLEHWPRLENEVHYADVIVLCFDSQRRDTLLRIRTHWMPEVTRLKPKAPVILACCKADSDDRREIEDIRDLVETIVHDFGQIEACLNCSAKKLKMVQDVFYFAMKSVIYPLSPLYDRVEKQLKPLCVKALKRIFLMCDIDKDEAMNDQELNSFQVLCFNTPLQPDELHNVKEVVRSKMPAGVNERGLTLSGFIFLHALFIERGRLESTWAVMRRFGYNESLKLNDELLDRVPAVQSSEHVMELSDVALDFLTRQFEQYDHDHDGLLSFSQLENMCSTSPHSILMEETWNKVLVKGAVGSGGGLCKDAFLAKWQYCALRDVRATLAHLLYLGFNGPTGLPVQSLFSRRPRWQGDKKTDLAHRSCFHCLVFGSKGSGKSSVLKSLVGKKFEEQVGGGELVAAAAVKWEQQEKLLVMTEVPCPLTPGAVPLEASAPDPLLLQQLLPASLDLAAADVALFVFDCSSVGSLRAACALLLAASMLTQGSLPCVLVGSREDIGKSQELDMEMSRLVHQLALKQALLVSCATGAGLAQLFPALLAAAANPEQHIPDTPFRKVPRSALWRLGMYASAVAAGGVLAYTIYYLTSSSHRSKAASTNGTIPMTPMPPSNGSSASSGGAGPLGGLAGGADGVASAAGSLVGMLPWSRAQ